jgi:hypothetical protein
VTLKRSGIRQDSAPLGAHRRNSGEFRYTLHLPCRRAVLWYDGRSVAVDPTIPHREYHVGVKKTGKGRRKLGRKKRRMRAKIRHRKG